MVEVKQNLSPAVIVIVVLVVVAVVGLIGWKVLGGAGRQKVTDEGAPVPLPDDQVSPGIEESSRQAPAPMPDDQVSGGG